MDMMDYLYNEEIIMRNHDAQLVRESEKRGEARGISIGEQRAALHYAAEIEKLRAENARLRAGIV